MTRNSFGLALALLLLCSYTPMYAEESDLTGEILAIYEELEAMYQAHQALSETVRSMSDPLLTASDALARLQAALDRAAAQTESIAASVSAIERELSDYETRTDRRISVLAGAWGASTVTLLVILLLVAILQ